VGRATRPALPRAVDEEEDGGGDDVFLVDDDTGEIVLPCSSSAAPALSLSLVNFDLSEAAGCGSSS
jgi:hypothetical protein